MRIGREIARDSLASAASNDPADPILDIVLIGGDGTTHELLNGLYLHPSSSTPPPAVKASLQIRLAIVPGGTANALYSAMYPADWTQEVQHRAATTASIGDLDANVLDTMLQSVRALVSAKEGRLEGLPLLLNGLEDGQGEEWLISHLVTSHALHAAILHDADTPEMRAQHKGIERFKAAAQMNATRWTHGRLSLDGGSGGSVQRYTPSTRAFEPVAESTLEGPFLYLNVMVTDRLESSFVPAPLSSAFSEGKLPAGAIDVVTIRPRRDPSVAAVPDEKEAGIYFATTRLGDITAGMYSGGKHIDMTYTDGEPVVEYFRCQGYTFEPGAGEGEDGKAKLVCTDGFISTAARTRVTRWTDRQETGCKQVRQGVAAPLVWL